MTASIWLLTAALALTGPDGAAKAPAGKSPAAETQRDARSRQRRELTHGAKSTAANPVDGTPGEREVDRCQVTLIDVVDVAAQEAGLLKGLEVREGSEIKEGDLIGQINDSKMRMAKKVAEAEHKVALAEAENDIAIRYSEKAYEVARQEWVVRHRANQQVPGSTPEVEMEKLKLQAEKSKLEIEKAELERTIASLTAESKEASVEAADDDIHRRRILAPLDGVVAEVFRHHGEWVNPGDRVVQLLRMNKLRVEGDLNIAEVSPSDIVGRPVRIVAKLTGGKQEQFQGKVVFVDLRILTGGVYRVKAEVVNRQENGAWTLLPGTTVNMFIDSGVAKLTDRSRR
ncbi:MAG TPA: HlyD family efflux transporter periplasmic adaptor subunit [Pirellulales bacterium]|nr:HlyD family efflux transporter periplasmic adaptor subunit [Pirellulales bacterium]